MKDDRLTIDNAELALQYLLSASTSGRIDIVKIACKALRYYIESEELKLTNKIVTLPNDDEIIAAYLRGESIKKTFRSILNREDK